MTYPKPLTRPQNTDSRHGLTRTTNFVLKLSILSLSLLHINFFSSCPSALSSKVSNITSTSSSFFFSNFSSNIFFLLPFFYSPHSFLSNPIHLKKNSPHSLSPSSSIQPPPDIHQPQKRKILITKYHTISSSKHFNIPIQASNITFLASYSLSICANAHLQTNSSHHKPNNSKQGAYFPLASNPVYLSHRVNIDNFLPQSPPFLPLKHSSLSYISSKNKEKCYIRHPPSALRPQLQNFTSYKPTNIPFQQLHNHNLFRLRRYIATMSNQTPPSSIVNTAIRSSRSNAQSRPR